MTDTEMSENRYRTLVEESNDIATIIDTDGTMTYVSPTVRRVLGYEPEKITLSDSIEGILSFFR